MVLTGRASEADPVRAPLGCLSCAVTGCTFSGGDGVYRMLLNSGAYLQFVCPCPDASLKDAHKALTSEGKQLVPAARRSEAWHVAAVKELCDRKAAK